RRTSADALPRRAALDRSLVRSAADAGGSGLDSPDQHRRGPGEPRGALRLIAVQTAESSQNRYWSLPSVEESFCSDYGEASAASSVSSASSGSCPSRASADIPGSPAGGFSSEDPPAVSSKSSGSSVAGSSAICGPVSDSGASFASSAVS